ncbi:MAG: hypothetical protein EA399_04860 [Desulfovibrionales bacterium]|nr:MAG: hypothetical protein EA399_04860 [Desulfovibrionales bacterium]
MSALVLDRCKHDNTASQPDTKQTDRITSAVIRSVQNIQLDQNELRVAKVLIHSPFKNPKCKEQSGTCWKVSWRNTRKRLLQT